MNDTICAIATSQGVGAISIIRLSGDDSIEIVNKVLRNKPYYKDNGGVTFSGGEPLLQNEFLIEVCKELKKHNSSFSRQGFLIYLLYFCNKSLIFMKKRW